jgi:hypothetical protein
LGESMGFVDIWTRDKRVMRRPLTRQAVFFVMITMTFVAVSSSRAVAHDEPYSHIDIRLEADRAHGKVIAHVIDLAHEGGLEKPELLLDPRYAEQNLATLHKVLDSHVVIKVNDEQIQPQWQSFQVVADRKSSFDWVAPLSRAVAKVECLAHSFPTIRRTRRTLIFMTTVQFDIKTYSIRLREAPAIISANSCSATFHNRDRLLVLPPASAVTSSSGDRSASVGEAEAGLRSLHEPWANTTSPAGRMVLTVFAGIAEFEHELIHGRTRSGRVAAKVRGVRFGRPPKLTADQIALAQRLVGEGASVPEASKILNVHRATLYRALRS